jgi:hypothetical protein
MSYARLILQVESGERALCYAGATLRVHAFGGTLLRWIDNPHRHLRQTTWAYARFTAHSHLSRDWLIPNDFNAKCSATKVASDF